MSPTARTLEEIATCGGVSAVLSAGSTGGGHHWKLVRPEWIPTGAHRAGTQRRQDCAAVVEGRHLHRNGRQERHPCRADRRGGHCTGPREFQLHERSVTVSDPTGRPLGNTKRHKKDVTVYGPDDVPLAEFSCDGKDPWPVRRPSGDDIGEVLAGEPGPSLSAPLWQWALETQWALNTTTYRQAMHLGLRRVNRYSFTPTSPVVPILALLPLLCGLSY